MTFTSSHAAPARAGLQCRRRSPLLRQGRSPAGPLPDGGLHGAAPPSDRLRRGRRDAPLRRGHAAKRAHELGLINHVGPDGQALGKAKEITQRIAKNGPLAVKAIVATLRATETLPEEQAFEIEQKHRMAVMVSADAIEGPRAFFEKREPVLQGK